jgi:hypothetical protein
METPRIERRRARRIAHRFILYTRHANPLKPEGDWSVATVINISKTGILFYSSSDYKLGSKLEIRLTIPSQAKCMCQGTVIRLLPSKRMNNIYEAAVDLSDMDEESKKALDETLSFFIQKEDNRERP